MTKKINDFRPDYLSVWLLFCLFLFAVIYRQYSLLGHMEWGDESETIVTAKMIASGKKLYSEIFNHHGPLVFLPGLILEKFGSFGIQGHRVFIAVLTFISFLMLYFSPINSNKYTRLILTSISVFIYLIYMPDFFAHMYKYQVICALLTIIILSQYTIPSITNPENLKNSSVFISSILIFSLPFLSITYIPWSLILFLISFKRTHYAIILLASLFAIGFNFLFLYSSGSVKGYYEFHIFLNSKILPLFQNDLTISNFIYLIYSSIGFDRFNFLWALLIFFTLAKLARYEYNFPWKSLFLGAGLLSLLIRGTGFHALPFYVSIFPLILLFKFDIKNYKNSFYFLCIWLIYAASKLFMAFDSDREIFASKKIPSSTAFSELVRTLTNKNDKILAFSFQNYEYIAADRLPASGHFFYLPWQDLYLKHPNPKFNFNPCSDLESYRPKFVLIDKYDKWSTRRPTPWGTDSYGACIQAYIDENYTKFPGISHTYIRNDLKALGVISDYPPTKLETSYELNPLQPISIKFNDENLDNLKKIGLMFGTSSRKNLGEAFLIVNYTDNTSSVFDINLELLPDFQYLYFDVINKKIKDAKIISKIGGGVTLWGVRDSRNKYFSCIVYVQDDENNIYTPGCPLK